jgi:hypothetical protein
MPLALVKFGQSQEGSYRVVTVLRVCDFHKVARFFPFVRVLIFQCSSISRAFKNLAQDTTLVIFGTTSARYLPGP